MTERNACPPPFAGPCVPGRFACVADRVFDGERLLPDHAVVVEGEAIAAVVPADSLPPDLPRLYEPDCTLLPGLVDIHTHFMRWMGPQFLAWGVMTIRDIGNPLDWILARRRDWPANPWPRILCTGPLLDGPTPLHPLVARGCRDYADALAAVRETAVAGVDGIKLYNRLHPGWLRDMTRVGHEAGLQVSMHCQTAGVRVALDSGVDEFHHLDGILADVWKGHPAGWLELWGHPEFARTRDEQTRLADDLAAEGMAATPTFAYWESQWRLRTPGGYEALGVSQHVPPDIVRWHSPGGPDADAAEQWHRALEAAQGFVGLLLARDAPVLAGSDTPCGPTPPGLSLWRELALLVEAGMTPLQALQTATATAAGFLGRPELGRLRPDAAADLVFVRGDPSRRIPERPEVPLIVRSGEVFRSAGLLFESAADAADLNDEPWAAQFRAHATGA